MSAREIVSLALKETGKTQQEAAHILGMTAQGLNQRLVRKTVRADDFLRLMDLIGVDVRFVVRDTGEVIEEPIPRIAGHGPRVRGNSDHVTYDTKFADAISNNFFADGEHEYGPDGTALELYVDKEGRYFFAEYGDEGKEARVRSASGSLAAAFIEKYGNVIDKRPSK